MAAFCYGAPVPPIDALDTFTLLDAVGGSDEPFWQLVRAAKNFFDRHGVLPHYGDCPDMEALPRYFRALKDIYKAKADADWAEVMADRCITAKIDPEFAARFAANVWRIGAVIYERLPVYLERRPPEQCWDPDEKTRFDQRACVQLLFVAARHFAKERGRSPGKADSEEMCRRIVQLGAPESIAADFAAEFCRYDATVLPSVVASLASIMAGEVTKLIIGQAKPAPGLVVYDALHGILEQQA
jgi:amyloid beta precursor protein binding protein 1